MRGSPIRKSSDQRSVDSSPRLIAASYVLHRLLVPRHPPCALNNLTTQTPTPTHHTRQSPTTTPSRRTRRRPDPNTCRWTSAGIQIHTYKLARCSRPLCSSQRTDRHPTSPTASPGHPGRYDEHEALREETVARSLRTQQRAYNRLPHTTTFHAPHPEGHDSCTSGDLSHRPNWSVFHPRAPPPTPEPTHDWAGFTVGARLWTNHPE